MADEPFVLDRVENPHPAMLAEAVELRRRAEGHRGWPSQTAAYDRGAWDGYLLAMCKATGEKQEAILAWMERAAS